MDGTIINKADFDKLVWNGDHNMGGKITYVAVQSNEANAAKVEGAEEKTLTVSESATITHPSAPASNPAQNQQQGGAGRAARHRRSLYEAAARQALRQIKCGHQKSAIKVRKP